MSRSRLLLIALILCLTGVFVWFLFQDPDRSPVAQGGPSATRGGSQTANETVAAWPPQKVPSPEPFTFEHEGKTVTLDLAGVGHAHRFLQRIPAEPGKPAADMADLEFDFLQWPERKFTGTETIKTRRCWVVDFTNPAKTGPHMLVRLFVDEVTGSFMRITGFDFDGKRVVTQSVQAGMRVNGELAAKATITEYFQPGTGEVLEVRYSAPLLPRK
jgi:hypothetical protein